MKKTAALVILAFAPLLASADTITNYVYVVSNLYFREVREITNNVKNTHFNYYYTNNVSTIQNVYQVTYKTNVTYNVDVSDEAIARASSEADRAERAATNAISSVEAAAASATAAGQAASRAASSATAAETSAQNAANAANNGLNAINARINWFDQHSGETITQNNYYWTTNLYFAEDSTARAGVASLQSEVSDISDRLDNFRPDRITHYTSDGQVFSYSFVYKSLDRVDLVLLVDSSSATDYRWDATDYWKYTYSTTGTGLNGVKEVKMRKSDCVLIVTLKVTSTTSTDILFSPVATTDGRSLPKFNSPDFGVNGSTYYVRFDSAPEVEDYHVGADLGIYRNGTKTDSLMLESRLEAALERLDGVADSVTRMYSPDKSQFITGDLSVYRTAYDTTTVSGVPLSFIGSDGTKLTRVCKRTAYDSRGNPAYDYYIYVSSENQDSALIDGGANGYTHYIKGAMVFMLSGRWYFGKFYDQTANFRYRSYSTLFGGIELENGSDAHLVTWYNKDEPLVYARGALVGTLVVQ